LAQSGHALVHRKCPLSGVKRTSQLKIPQYHPVRCPQETSPLLSRPHARPWVRASTWSSWRPGKAS